MSAVSAGLRSRCPRCGRGKLFKGYLTVADRCEVFVILILGFVVVGLALWVELSWEPPFWVHALLWVPLIIGGALLMLRPLKATLIALHYKHRSEDYESAGR